MYPIKDMLGRIQEDGIIVNLFLTEQCNFACDHCFYAAGPNLPKGYMSDGVLQDVRAFVDACINDLLVPRVTINFIGGEPTLNMKEFKRCLETVMRWTDEYGHRLDWEMTTNGWWLSKDKHTIEFLEAIRPYIPHEGTSERNDGGRWNIRVSDTLWHQEWRKGALKGRSVASRVKELFQEFEGYTDDNPFYSCTSVCNACGYTVEGWLDGEECEWCHDGMLESKEEGEDFPRSKPDEGWIYADTWNHGSGVVPSNPERGQFGGNDQGERGGSRGCGEHMIVTFKPDGTHIDGCGKGSNMPFGSVRDHPLVLLGMNNSFLVSERPSCRDCYAAAQQWKDDDQHVADRAYYTSVLETFESGDMMLEEDDGSEREYVGFGWKDPMTGEFEWLECDYDPR